MNCFAQCCFALCALLAATSIVRAGDTPACHIGSYRLADENMVDLAPSEYDTLRLRQCDGATGVLHKTANGDWKGTYDWTATGDGRLVSFSSKRRPHTRLPVW
jgi:hypothetical protein